MGWSSWNKVRCKFNASVLLEIGEAMAKSGMVAAGYKSLNIDDCWPSKERAADGSIVGDPEKFPDGMGAFSAELTERTGLGLGIYTAHGNLTCQKYPGSLGFEEKDAATYASWNVSFVKNDWCWRNEPNASKHMQAFEAMRDALGKQKNPIVYSIHWNVADVPGPGCDHGVDCPLPQLANMWRVGGDIRPSWDSVLRLIDKTKDHADKAGPGSWNDADMLEVGNGMTVEQDRAHFSMWCILASPLVAGNDPREMSPETIVTLTNPHAIAVNQDPFGKQAVVVAESEDETRQVWAKLLSSPEGSYAVAFLNRAAGDAKDIKLAFADLPGKSESEYRVLDLWEDAKTIGTFTDSIKASVNGTSAALYKLIPVRG